MPRYDTERDAAQALSSSIILFDNKPVYVRGCHSRNDMRIRGVGRRDQEGENVQIDSPLVDLTPVSLGYINQEEGKPLFASRMPIRRWKQGLNEGNLKIGGLAPQPRGARGRGPALWDSVALGLTIQGIFPSFDECLDKVESLMHIGSAFCRNFAIIDGTLEHRGRLVGVVEDGEPVLFDQFQYLQQSLDIGLR